MTDPKYNKNVGERLQTYINHGIIPSIDLITTYESLEHPLSADEVQKIVEEYFLSYFLENTIDKCVYMLYIYIYTDMQMQTYSTSV